MFNTVYTFVMQNLGTVLGTVLPLIELFLRALPTQKPVSLIIAAAAIIRKVITALQLVVSYALKVVEMLAKILEFIDKIIPQNVTG